jgi:hypothetical protein
LQITESRYVEGGRGSSMLHTLVFGGKRGLGGVGDMDEVGCYACGRW